MSEFRISKSKSRVNKRERGVEREIERELIVTLL